MKTLWLLTLLLIQSGNAASDAKNPVSRYFRRVPIENANRTWGEATPGALPSKLNVLVWNVKKGMREAFSEEFKKFGQGRDIFLVQEAYTADYFIDVIKSFTEYQWELGISFTYRLYNNFGTGNMIGSHVKSTWVRVEHTQDLEPLIYTPKTTVYAKYALEGREDELLVVSIHGINFANTGSFTRHLLQVYDNIKTHTGPVIVAGDFNTRTKERMRVTRHLMMGIGLSEVEFENSEIRMTSVGTDNHLDHAFIRGFNVQKAEVHPSPGSDHKPMSMQLDLQ